MFSRNTVDCGLAHDIILQADNSGGPGDHDDVTESGYGSDDFHDDEFNGTGDDDDDNDVGGDDGDYYEDDEFHEDML